LNGRYTSRLAFAAGDNELEVSVEYGPDICRIDSLDAVLHETADGRYRVRLGEQQFPASAVERKGAWHVFQGGRHDRLVYRDPISEAVDREEDQSELTAPMPGRIVALSHAAGDAVAKGAPLLIMEAMKMELTVDAPAAGRVVAYHCAAGDQVMDGDELVEFEPDA
jgi:3-methylcrotonyl-CoA carboxylase alpha subunit